VEKPFPRNHLNQSDLTAELFSSNCELIINKREWCWYSRYMVEKQGR